MSDLIELSRDWVKQHYQKNADHLFKAEEWLRRIAPHASQAMILAALTHDMERAFPGPDSPKPAPSRGPDDPVYNQAHSERSARIVSDFLRDHQASEALIEDVAHLIRRHEIGGSPEADLVQAADSLSFLEVNIGFFLQRVGAAQDGWTLDQVRAKFDWMYDRIKVPEARALAAPLYEAALEQLQMHHSNSTG